MQGQGGSATSSESDSSRPMRGAASIVGDEGGLEQLAKGGGLVVVVVVHKTVES